MRRRGGPAGRGQGYGGGGGGSGRGSGPLCRRRRLCGGVRGAVTQNFPLWRRRRRAVSAVSAPADGTGAAGPARRRGVCVSVCVWVSMDARGGGPCPRPLFAAGGSVGAKWRPPAFSTVSPTRHRWLCACRHAWPGCPRPGRDGWDALPAPGCPPPPEAFSSPRGASRALR